MGPELASLTEMNWNEQGVAGGIQTMSAGSAFSAIRGREHNIRKGGAEQDVAQFIRCGQ